MHENDERLSGERLRRILDRLRLSAQPRPTLDGLAEVYRAWSRSVPFDNTRKLIHMAAGAPGRLPGDSVAEFFDAWLRWGTGGTCWAGNGALCLLLRSLGFDAERGVATMLIVPDLPPNHGTVIVRVGGGRFMVDASILHSEPLALEDDAPSAIDHPAWGVTCARRDGKWHVLWKPLHQPGGFECRLDRVGASAQEFAERHEDTRGWSPFNYQVNARLIRDGRVVGLAFGQRVEIDADGQVSMRSIDDRERRRVLVEELGLHPELVGRVPEDRNTPPPPSSRTAQRQA